MELRSFCATHGELLALTSCSRCGRFCCEGCLARIDRCTECQVRVMEELPSLSFAATCAGWSLLLSGLTTASLIPVLWFESRDDWAADVLAALVILAGLSTLVSVVTVPLWFHRATRHALARGASLDVGSPALATLSWFLPLYNFVKPFSLLRQMYMHAQRPDPGITTWQVLWIIVCLTTRLSTDDGGWRRLVGSGFCAVFAGAAFIGARVIRGLRWSA